MFLRFAGEAVAVEPQLVPLAAHDADGLAICKSRILVCRRRNYGFLRSSVHHGKGSSQSGAGQCTASSVTCGTRKRRIRTGEPYRASMYNEMRILRRVLADRRTGADG